MTGYKKNRMSTSEKMRKSLNELNHNKIWVTKKIRMNASERMRKKIDLINYILIYFSGCLSVMMVLSLYSPTISTPSYFPIFYAMQYHWY